MLRWEEFLEFYMEGLNPMFNQIMKILNMNIMIQSLWNVLKIFYSFMNLLDQNCNVTQFYGLGIQQVEISI